jgi:hypothetical protein
MIRQGMGLFIGFICLYHDVLQGRRGHEAYP